MPNNNKEMTFSFMMELGKDLVTPAASLVDRKLPSVSCFDFPRKIVQNVMA